MELLGKVFGVRRRSNEEDQLTMLPAEILTKVMSKLDYKDLSCAMLVSRKWREMAEDPLLWRKFPLVYQAKGHEGIPDVNAAELTDILAFSRFTLLETVKITNFDRDSDNFQQFYLTDRHLDTVMNHGKVQGLVLELINLSKVSRTPLAGLVREVVRLELEIITMEKEVVENLLSEILEHAEDKKLEELVWNHGTMVDGGPWPGEGFKKVCPHLFGQSLSKVKHLEVSQLKLTNSQLTSLLENMSLPSSQVEHLSVKDEDFHAINPMLMAKAISSLKSLELQCFPIIPNCMITPAQIQALMEEIVAMKNMKHIKFDSVKSDSVPSNTLAQVVRNLDSLFMDNTQLTTEQLGAILSNINTDERNTFDFLGLPHNNLSTLSPAKFGNQLQNIKKLELNACMLTTDLAESLFEVIISGSKIKELDIGTNHLENVNEELLAKAVNRLTVAKMFCSGIQPRQVKAIFNVSLEQTHLYHLDLRESCESKIHFHKSVPGKLIRAVKEKIPELLIPIKEPSLLNPVNFFNAVSQMLEDSD